MIFDDRFSGTSLDTTKSTSSLGVAAVRNDNSELPARCSGQVSSTGTRQPSNPVRPVNDATEPYIPVLSDQETGR
jgi:hypothetical protein